MTRATCWRSAGRRWRSPGVRLRAIANATGSDIAYNVVTEPVPAAGCGAAPARAFNAMTIYPNGREIRVECVWHDGITLAVARVETVEVLPLSAWYLDPVPPSAVGIEPWIARGHPQPETGAPCGFALPPGGAKWARTRRNRLAGSP
jgi:hypothetical protein